MIYIAKPVIRNIKLGLQYPKKPKNAFHALSAGPLNLKQFLKLPLLMLKALRHVQIGLDAVQAALVQDKFCRCQV